MRATAAVPSVEPSSTTMISNGGSVWPSSDTTHSASIPARLKVGTMTLTREGMARVGGTSKAGADT